MKLTDEAQSNLSEGCAYFLVILALCFGIGGCSYLVNKGKAERERVEDRGK